MSFLDFHKKYSELINKELEVFLNKEIKNLSTNDPFIKECSLMLKEYTMAGGKRLRPISLIMSYLASGGKDEKKVLMPAIAVELYHTYTLILDDVMDEDEFRRNKPTLFKRMKDLYLNNFKEISYDGPLYNRRSSRFSVALSILFGNLTGIFSRIAFHESEYADALKLKCLFFMEKLDKMMCFGQSMDMYKENKEITEPEYLELAYYKTGVLFGIPMQIGSFLAGKNESHNNMFFEVGKSMAIAFQLQDDVIDILGEKGHEFGSDIKKGKRTILRIKANEKANIEQAKVLNNIFAKPNATDADIKKAIGIMRDTGAIDYCNKLSLHYNDETKMLLRNMRLDLYYSILFSEMSDFMINRSY